MIQSCRHGNGSFRHSSRSCAISLLLLLFRYVPPPIPGDTGVVMGPIPEGKENDSLVQELRTMVSGLKPLTRDAQKA